MGFITFLCILFLFGVVIYVILYNDAEHARRMGKRHKKDEDDWEDFRLERMAARHDRHKYIGGIVTGKKKLNRRVAKKPKKEL